jgi:hypothetical protein
MVAGIQTFGERGGVMARCKAVLARASITRSNTTTPPFREVNDEANGLTNKRKVRV